MCYTGTYSGDRHKNIHFKNRAFNFLNIDSLKKNKRKFPKQYFLFN